MKQDVALTAELRSSSKVRVWRAATEIHNSGDQRLLPILLKQLRHGAKALQREAAAYALGGSGGYRAVAALERTVTNGREGPKVRGQAAEVLAYVFANRSIPILKRGLGDPSKDVRFWCAFSLGVAGTLDRKKAAAALPSLRKLASSDKRCVRGFWSVADEAKWAVLRLEGKEREATNLEEFLHQTSNRLSSPRT